MQRFLFAALVLLLPSWSMALPINGMSHKTPLPKFFTSNYNFEGIVALSNCSGALVRFVHSSDSDRAMILTNGHCLEFGFPRPGTFHYGKPSQRTFTLLDASARPVGRIRATQIMYATMTGTDLALYRVNETYAQIESQFKIRALVMSNMRPSTDHMIEVISGYWRRGFTCAVETFVRQMREDGYIWTDSLRYSRPGCETYGGTSGSPVVMQGTRVVLGVNNTGNENGRLCTMNNPCEIGDDGKPVAYKGFAYGQQSYWVYSCLNNLKEIDLNRPGCMLFKGGTQYF